MPITKTVTLYSFTELSEKAQQKAIDDNRFDVDSEWYDFTIDDRKEVLEALGFSNVNIGFSGFCSQGDGAHFTGNYQFKKGALKNARKNYPEWKEYDEFATELFKIQRKNKFSFSAKLAHRGRYQHSNTAYVVESESDLDLSVSENWNTLEQSVLRFIEACRKFMDSIYRDLEQEHDYLISDEAVKERLEDNDGYVYLEDGSKE